MTHPDRLAQLEALYAALARHQDDPRNATWRPVLEAFKAVGKAPVEDTFEKLKISPEREG